MSTPPPRMEMIATNDLHFDPENPRLPRSLHDAPEEKVLDWMLKGANLVELMGSIGETGFFPGEPLLVTRDSEGKLIVVEGNRRLAAVKLLLDPDKAPRLNNAVAGVAREAKSHPRELPVLIYPTRDDILQYLGFRHITGVKAWGPLEKARYLSDLQDNPPYAEIDDAKRRHNELAKTIGSKGYIVARLLTGYELFRIMEEHAFFDIADLNEETITFSIITTALSASEITEFLDLGDRPTGSAEGVNQDHLIELTKWLFEKVSTGKGRKPSTVLGESRNLQKLAPVLANDKALEMLRSGSSLDEAHIFTGGPLLALRLLMGDALTSIQNAYSQAPTVRGLEAEDESRAKSLEDYARSLRREVSDAVYEEERRRERQSESPRHG